MKNPFRLLSNIHERVNQILEFFKTISEKLEVLKIKPVSPTIVDLNRHQLGSIDLTDILDGDALLGEERKEYLRNAELLWVNPVFQHETKKIIRKQLEFIGIQAPDLEAILVGRGTINGVDLLRERVEKLHVLHKEKPEQSTPLDFNKFEIGV